MKLLRKVGVTSEIWQVFVQDSSSTTGAGLTGLVFNTAGLTAYYHRDTDTTATAITLATMTVGTFTSSGFKEIDATNMPGWYQFCPPDAALATGAKSCGFHLKGATNMAPLPIEVDLQGDVNLTHWLGTAASIPTVAGVPNVNVKTWNDLTTVALPLVPTTAGRTLDVSLGGEAGVDWANVGTPGSTVNLSATTVNLVNTATTVTNQLTAAAIATGVWQDATAGDFTVASSIGKGLYINNVAPGGSGGLLISGSNSGTTTFGALTCTGSFTISDGLLVSRSSANSSAITATGNGTGSGGVFTSGSGATGDGVQMTAASTNGKGLNATGTGTGDGILTTGGSTSGTGLHAHGGGTGHGIKGHSGSGATGDGIVGLASSTNGNGLACEGSGSGDGVDMTAGPTGRGCHIVGGVSSGNALRIEAGAGSIALDIVGTVTTTGLVTFNAFTVTNATTLTGAVSLGSTLAVTGTTTLAALTTTGTVTFNAFTITNAFIVSGTTTLTGAVTASNASNNIVGVAWNAAWDAEVQSECTDALNAYDGPTNAEMEARTLVAASYATPTNITAGTITTVTNLTNAPTAGDLTAAMKASVNVEVVDALSVDTYAEPTGIPAATDDLAAKIGFLYEALRNKLTVSATAKTFFDDAGAAQWSKVLADDGTTYTESEGA